MFDVFTGWKLQGKSEETNKKAKSANLGSAASFLGTVVEKEIKDRKLADSGLQREKIPVAARKLVDRL